MRKLIGVNASWEYSIPFLEELRQQALLFDKLSLPTLSIFRANYNPNLSIYKTISDALDFLEGKGIVIDGKTTDLDVDDFLPDADMAFLNGELDKVIGLQEDDVLMKDYMARVTALIFNSTTLSKQGLAVPISNSLPPLEKIDSRKGAILNIILKEIPIPSVNTPWEKIIEYRSDEDSIGKFAGLRTWVTKMSKTNSSIDEIEEELRYLTHLYSKSLEAHKIKSEAGILQTIIVGAGEVAEKVARLKFGELAKMLFEIRKEQADLISTEVNSKGAELAYLYKTRSTFKSK